MADTPVAAVPPITTEMVEAGYAIIESLAATHGESWALGMVAKSEVTDALWRVYKAMRAMEGKSG